MTDREKLIKAGCSIDSFCVYSGGHHACRYMKNHSDNQAAPSVCENGSHFALNPNIDKKYVDAWLEMFND